jgi:hypothetical protein
MEGTVPNGNVLHDESENDKIGNVYSLEYTDITNVAFTPHHVANLFNNVIRHLSDLGHSCANVM